MEFCKWETPLNSGDISILSVVYGCRDWDLSSHNVRYEYQDSRLSGDVALIVTVFHDITESVYEVQFRKIGGHRVLDEHGLLDMWDVSNPRENCFKVRKHQWANESPLSFELNTIGGWSYVMATDFECVEVLTDAEPKIVLIERLPNLKSHKK